jgi:hypothetical protein
MNVKRAIPEGILGVWRELLMRREIVCFTHGLANRESNIIKNAKKLHQTFVLHRQLLANMAAMVCNCVYHGPDGLKNYRRGK